MSGFSINDGLGEVQLTGEPAAAQADTTLIRLDKFRADPRFAGIDGSNQTVVVIDTGIDLDHPFFGTDNGNGIASRIVASYDFSGANDADATDVNGHGSNVASIVGSSDATYTGMAPGCNIIALKVFTDAGGATTADIAEALDWVAANREAYNIVSVNMSLGYGDNQSGHVSSPFASQIAELHDNGCAVVVASGNSYYQYQTAGVSTPSADPNAWSVGAVWDRDVGAAYWYGGAIDYTTGADHITSFSQRGPGVTTILAPGGAITGANWDGGTVTESGTSQAAPHIAGLVADMQQLAEQVSGHAMSVDDLRDTMAGSGVKIYDGSNSNDNEVHTYGTYARVDALAWGTAILNKLFAGTSGDDTLNGTAVSDVIHGGAGSDALRGGDGNDTLYGDAGNDILDGGAGANMLAGGTGDDTYIVSSAADKVIELPGQGTDTVLNALASYTLTASVENLTHTGAGDFRGTGNSLNNVITGGSGADVLDGGAGADTLTGGEGDDVYAVDNAGDAVIEDYFGGTDTVRTSLNTYTLAHEVET
jgi:subtilisin family serine protease